MNGAISISGTNGGPIGRAASQLLKTAVYRLFNGQIGMDEFRRVEANLPRRQSLTMLVNNECNLACRHCYLQLPSASRQRLSADDWRNVLDSAANSGVEHFVIAGKEVFLGKTGPAVVDHLRILRQCSPEVRTGVITNGTLLHQHRDRIAAADLTYIDISMEGGEADHDFIRGSGAYAAVRPNVEWATKALGDRVFITLTIQKHNLHRFTEALVSFAKLGVSNVGASFYCPLPYTDRSLDLTFEETRDFFDNLRNLGSVPLDRELAVQVDAGIVSPDAVRAFMESEWFNLDTMEVDRTGFLYSRFRFCNGLLLCFRFIPWPLAVNHSSRLSVDGELVAVDDSLRPRLYHLNTLGNIRDYKFDFLALQRAAVAHPRVTLLDSQYESAVLPAFQASWKNAVADAGVDALAVYK
jgi:MoaA/NifB/PqqE/SkfB family radical SAM enzyme